VVRELEIDKEILKGHIDTIILALLQKKPMYGYEIAKMVQEKSQERFELKEGTMYLALKRLEKNHFIESYWGDDHESGGGRRKYYRILPLGSERYHLKNQEWNFVKGLMDTFFGEGK
jgi:DNA-binding PadR family transcriptional regulator